MKTAIIGNGIDIQYGGFDKRGNRAIIERALKNLEEDKYYELGWKKESVKEIIEICNEVINKIILHDVSIPEKEDYLFLQMEMERVRRQYKEPIDIYEIGLEDIFLGTEILYLNSINEKERGFVERAIYDYLHPLLLDAIYDDGKVNEIYKNFPKSLVEYLKTYDEIFTLNYDTNLERALGDEIPIHHLHGCFFDYVEGRDVADDRYKHMFCNGIMTWYWLEKYGEESTDLRYGVQNLTDIEGTVDIIGISPCNDEQLYIRLWQNNKLRNCNYYYFNRTDAIDVALLSA